MWLILKPLLRRPLMPLLIVLQIAVACAICCNALFLLQQKLAPIMAPIGVADPGNLVVLSNIAVKGKAPATARWRSIEAELRAIPGVLDATYAASFPMVGNTTMGDVVWSANSPARVSAVYYQGDNLVDTLGLRLLAGRNFTPSEEAAAEGETSSADSGGPVIITRALAERLFPGGHAVGRLVYSDPSTSPPNTVVGVVADLMRNTPAQNVRELDYSILSPGILSRWPLAIFAVRIDTSNESHMCHVLRSVIHHDLGSRLLPYAGVNCNTYAGLRDLTLAQPRAAVWLLSGVTLIVLIVTLTGVMGLTGYWVQQRTREIGIRRALGATRGNILRYVQTENLLVVAVGAILGLIAAYGVNLWLMQHYQLLRLPWEYLPVGAALLLVLGQLAVLKPALYAARVPPVVATRSV